MILRGILSAALTVLAASSLHAEGMGFLAGYNHSISGSAPAVRMGPTEGSTQILAQASIESPSYVQLVPPGAVAKIVKSKQNHGVIILPITHVICNSAYTDCDFEIRAEKRVKVLSVDEKRRHMTFFTAVQDRIPMANQSLTDYRRLLQLAKAIDLSGGDLCQAKLLIQMVPLKNGGTVPLVVGISAGCLF